MHCIGFWSVINISFGSRVSTLRTKIRNYMTKIIYWRISKIRYSHPWTGNICGKKVASPMEEILLFRARVTSVWSFCLGCFACIVPANLRITRYVIDRFGALANFNDIGRFGPESFHLSFIYTELHIVQRKNDLSPQKINKPMGCCMYLYLFTSTAWKFICTVCSTV